MSRLVLTICLCLTLTHAAVDNYNVLWTNFAPESSTSYVNTMPIGNGDLCANIWADNSTGTVTVLISKADAWSEAQELMKVGFVHYSFNPNPFSQGNRFRQLLQLANATVRFEIGGSSGAIIVGTVYIDAHQNTIVAQFNSGNGQNFVVTVKSELVRTSQQNVSPAFDCQAFPVSADIVVTDTSGISTDPVIAWYHRNAQESFVRTTLNNLNLSPLLSQALNPILNRTIGGVVFAKGFTRQDSNTLVSPSGQSFTVGVSVVSQVTNTVNDWYNLLKPLLTIPAYSNHASYWQAFWSRSYIEVSSDNTVASQYALWRYTQGLQASAPYEIKFNGLLFTANRPPNVDYRDWGGLNWWQNSRLSYYNMLAAGDTDFLLSFFQLFLEQLPFAKAKTQLYYNYTDGSAFWDEYNSIIGTTHPSSYGCGRAGKTSPPIWYSEDPWNHYNLQGSLDLSLFVLDHYYWTQDGAALTKYLPIAVSVVQFYSNYFKQTDSNGKIVLYPTQAIETWQCPNYPPDPNVCATNDAPTIAGLLAVIPKLLALPTSFTTQDQRNFWQAFLNKIPALPTVGSGSSLALAPCQKCPPTTSNVENAELYPVHPYRLYTVGRLGLNSTAIQPALVAFRNKKFTSDEGWNQNAMDAALLGLASQAQTYVHNRAAMAPADGYRFPAFSPHLQDYQPSQDQLSVFNNALQYMLIQVADDASGTIVLLPSWPCNWNVDFKLNGPIKTVIEGSVQGGKLTYTVTPSSRAGNVKALNCQ